MGVAKVTLNGETLIDVTGKTVDASSMLSGTTALDKKGDNIVGTYTDSDFVVTLTKNASTGYWEPDCTYAEAKAAYDAGKNVVAATTDEYTPAFFTYSEDESCFYYAVQESSSGALGMVVAVEKTYYLDSDGIHDDGDINLYETHHDTATPSQVLSGATFHNASGYQTGTMPINTAFPPALSLNSSTGVITGTNTFSEGHYSVGTQTSTLSLATQAAKTVTPTESIQRAVSAGYYTTGDISVAAISSTYVGTGVAKKSAADLTASGSTVTVPAGYYSSQATKNVASASSFPPAISLNSSTGVITGTNTFASGYYAASTKTSTFQLTSKAAATYYPSTADQTVASNQWLTGAQTIKSVTLTNLIASNIASGVTVKVGDSANASRITQITGTHQGGIIPSGTFSITSNGSFDVTNYASASVSVPPMYTATISGSGYGNRCVVKLNDNTSYYTDGDTFTFTENDTLKIQAAGSRGGGTINVNGIEVAKDVYNSVSYTLTDVRKDVVFTISYGSEGIISAEFVDYQTIDITENGTQLIHPYDVANVSVPGIIPSGTLNITENGTYDVTNYASASVSAGVSSIYKSIYNRTTSGMTNDAINAFLNQSTIIPSYAFAGWKVNYTSNLSNLYDVGNVIRIDEYAFHDCISLTSVDFPSVTQIGSNAFNGCISLTTANFPKVELIESSAFYHCSILSSVNVQNVVSIYDHAFEECWRLYSIDCPSATLISNYAFYSANISAASFPSAVSIGSYAFWNTKLINASFPEVTSIGSLAFGECRSLTTAHFPKATRINYEAFRSCYVLSDISFPVATYLSTSAFYNCSKLTLASFPSVSGIAEQTFYNCKSLLSAFFPEAKYISSSAFWGCTSLKTISFPKVSSIGYQAFMSCYYLSSVNFPLAQSTGDSAFYNCISLKTISFPIALQVGAYAFTGCTSLTKASFPAATRIYQQAFNGCTSLTTIDFPVVTSIGSSAFYNCGSLTSVNLPSLSEIGGYAFAMPSLFDPKTGSIYIQSLKSIYFPSVTYILANAFALRNNLSIISLPAVKSISNYAFVSCRSLISAYFLGTSVPKLGASVFFSTPIANNTYLGYFGSIYVRASMVDAFKSSTNWVTYSSRIVGLTDAEIEALG